MASFNDVWLVKIKEFRGTTGTRQERSQHYIDDNFILDILEASWFLLYISWCIFLFRFHYNLLEILWRFQELCHDNISEYVKLELLYGLQEKVSLMWIYNRPSISIQLRFVIPWFSNQIDLLLLVLSSGFLWCLIFNIYPHLFYHLLNSEAAWITVPFLLRLQSIPRLIDIIE